MSSRAQWDEWLASLHPIRRQQALDLRAAFAELGADDPESWARSEVDELIPQLARFLALRQIWERDIDRWSDPGSREIPVVKRLIESGADIADVIQLARLAAYEAAFGLLQSLTDEGYDPSAEPWMPGWKLVETAKERLTGREVGSLHESILSMDPSGREGSDLWT
jgi:hypothetical protein